MSGAVGVVGEITVGVQMRQQPHAEGGDLGGRVVAGEFTQCGLGGEFDVVVDGGGDLLEDLQDSVDVSRSDESFRGCRGQGGAARWQEFSGGRVELGELLHLPLPADRFGDAQVVGQEVGQRSVAETFGDVTVGQFDDLPQPSRPSVLASFRAGGGAGGRP